MKKISIFLLALSCNTPVKDSCYNSCNECNPNGIINCEEVCSDLREAGNLSECDAELYRYMDCLKDHEGECLFDKECSEERISLSSCIAYYCIANQDSYMCPRFSY